MLSAGVRVFTCHGSNAAVARHKPSKARSSWRQSSLVLEGNRNTVPQVPTSCSISSCRPLPWTLVRNKMHQSVSRHMHLRQSSGQDARFALRSVHTARHPLLAVNQDGAVLIFTRLTAAFGTCIQPCPSLRCCPLECGPSPRRSSLPHSTLEIT